MIKIKKKRDLQIMNINNNIDVFLIIIKENNINNNIDVFFIIIKENNINNNIDIYGIMLLFFFYHLYLYYKI